MFCKSSFCDTNACVEVEFGRSSFCDASTCVEVGFNHADQVLVRDGKNFDGPVLTFTAEEWRAFVAGVKSNEFDI